MQEQSVYDEQKIILNEQLFRIEGTKVNDILHRSIGALTFLNKNKSMNVGTGFLLSKNLILTSAHNLYDKSLRCETHGHKFYIGVNGRAKQYYEIESFKYPPEFITCPLSSKLIYDYALVKIKKEILFTQYLQLQVPCSNCLIRQNQQTILKVFGFPGKYSNYQPFDEYSHEFKLFQYGLARSNRIVLIDSLISKIGYGISTLNGQSGSPVTVNNKVIAIHSGGEKILQFNIGRLIDFDLLKNLKKWSKQMNSHQFSINSKGLCSCLQASVLEFLNFTCLTQLNLNKSTLKDIDLKKYLNLTELVLSYNQIQAIDLSRNVQLIALELSHNKLTEVDLRVNTQLVNLSLSYNKIISINLDYQTKLSKLWLSSNELAQISLLKAGYFTQLELDYNHLGTIFIRFAMGMSIKDYQDLYVFDDQRSNHCIVYSFHRSDDINQCNQLRHKWLHKYRKLGNHNHNSCSYSFQLIQQ